MIFIPQVCIYIVLFSLFDSHRSIAHKLLVAPCFAILYVLRLIIIPAAAAAAAAHNKPSKAGH